MVNQIILTLFLQAAFFVFYFKNAPRIAPIIGRRVCPVCFAVGSTWLALILLKYLRFYSVNTFIIAVLLAESVVGVSYLVEEFLLVYDLKFQEYILKFVIIIYGTFAVLVFGLINEFFGLLVFAPVIIFGFISLTPIKKNIPDGFLKTKLKKCC